MFDGAELEGDRRRGKRGNERVSKIRKSPSARKGKKTKRRKW